MKRWMGQGTVLDGTGDDGTGDGSLSHEGNSK